MAERKNRLLRRAAFAPVVLVASFMLFELVLQAGHLGGLALRDEPAAPYPDGQTVLCVGDSHTYGVRLPAEDSYPGQLQSILDGRGYRINVANAGVPGQNSSELRRALPGLIEKYRPFCVVVMIGFNNKWNRTHTAWSDVRDGAAPSGARGLFYKLWYGAGSRLKTVRMATYLVNEYHRRRDEVRHSETAFPDRMGGLHFHEWRAAGTIEDIKVVMERTRRDLHAIVDICRKNGAEPLFMTYAGQPGTTMELSNHLLRTAAGSRSVTLVDNHEVIWPMFMSPAGTMDEKSHELLFLDGPRETHLDKAGYAVVAENLADAIIDDIMPGAATR